LREQRRKGVKELKEKWKDVSWMAPKNIFLLL